MRVTLIRVPSVPALCRWKHLRRILVTLVVSTAMQNLYAQVSTAPVLSLADAIAMATVSNPKIALVTGQQAEAKADARSARSALFPKLGVSESFIDSTDPVFAFGTNLRQGRFTAQDLSLGRLNSPPATSDFASVAGGTWTVFDSGRSIHQLRSKNTAVAAAQLQTVATKQNISYAVVRDYYRALLADQEKLTSAAAVARAASFAKQAHDRVDAGTALESDAMQADIDLSQRTQEAAEALSNAKLAYADLAGTLGTPSKTFALIKPEGNPEPMKSSPDELQALALRRRPDLQAARLQIAAAQEGFKSSRAALGPQLSTFANVEADNPHLTSGGSTNWTVGAKVEVQLFDGGTRRAQMDNATAKREIAEARYKQAEIEAGVEVKRSYYALQTAQAQYAISADMLHKTQQTLQTSLDRYNAGLVTITEVLRQQDQLRYMELHRAETLYQWWIADAQLRLAVGDESSTVQGVHP